MQFVIIKKMAETNDSSQPRFEGDIFKTVEERIEQIFPNLRFIEEGKHVHFLNINHKRCEVRLEKDAILQREPIKGYSNRWKYFLLLAVLYKDAQGDWWTINAGKSIETYAPIRKIPKKKKPEIMTKLIENYPRLSRLKLLPQAVSPQKVG